MSPPNSPHSAPGGRGPRVILALPVADASATEAAEREGLTVVATATTAGLLKRQVAAVRPDVALLHAALPHADQGLVASFARAGIPTLLLVDAGVRRGDDALAGPPYPPYILARQERLGCVGVAAWPPIPGELLLRAEQAAEHAHLLVQVGRWGARVAPRRAARSLSSARPGGRGRRNSPPTSPPTWASSVSDVSPSSTWTCCAARSTTRSDSSPRRAVTWRRCTPRPPPSWPPPSPRSMRDAITPPRRRI